MDFKNHLVESSVKYNIFDISKSKISHLPYSLRVLFENYVRNNKTISEKIIKKFESWDGSIENQTELTFFPSRVIMQDFTGVPAVVDLASMRDAVRALNGDPALINPQCQTDLVIDHSVMVDNYKNNNSLKENVKKEFERNKERYEFLKWGQSSFDNFYLVPPGAGICHQVNL